MSTTFLPICGGYECVDPACDQEAVVVGDAPNLPAAAPLCEPHARVLNRSIDKRVSIPIDDSKCGMCDSPAVHAVELGDDRVPLCDDHREEILGW